MLQLILMMGNNNSFRKHDTFQGHILIHQNTWIVNLSNHTIFNHAIWILNRALLITAQIFYIFFFNTLEPIGHIKEKQKKTKKKM